MAGHSRYHVSDKSAGLEKSVLKNKFGLKAQKDIDDTEGLLLADTYEYFFERLRAGEVHFDLSLFFDIHKYFLEPLYEWAGKQRSIDISKDGMLFAPVLHLNETLKQFEHSLTTNIPREKDTKMIIARKLAMIHNEFNAIHPFREGNGRTVRLFLDLVAVYTGYAPINYGIKLTSYTKACIAGMGNNNLPMERTIYHGLRKAV